MKGVDNLKDNINFVIVMIVIIMLIGVIFIWAYNFIAVSDDKLFDDNNKYIDADLSNPDVETNYKDTYLNKNKLDVIWLSLLKWFGSLKGIVVMAFLFVFLFGLVLKNRRLVLDHLKNYFD